MEVKKHAVTRIRQRCSLTVREVRQIIASGKYYPIGRDIGREHEHRIIYSPPDDMLFVVVSSEDTNDIVTLLPIDYDKACRISESVLETAKRHLLGDYDKQLREQVEENRRLAEEKETTEMRVIRQKKTEKELTEQIIEATKDAESTKPTRSAKEVVVVANITYIKSGGLTFRGKEKNFKSRQQKCTKVGSLKYDDLVECGLMNGEELNHCTFVKCLTNETFRLKICERIEKMQEDPHFITKVNECIEMGDGVNVMYTMCVGGYSLKPLSLPIPWKLSETFLY